MIENKTKLTVRRIRSDRIGEHVCTDKSKHYKEKGIIHEPIRAFQLQKNVVAEIVNRTLFEKAWYMIYYHGLSRKC